MKINEDAEIRPGSEHVFTYRMTAPTVFRDARIARWKELVWDALGARGLQLVSWDEPSPDTFEIRFRRPLPLAQTHAIVAAPIAYGAVIAALAVTAILVALSMTLISARELVTGEGAPAGIALSLGTLALIGLVAWYFLRGK